MIVTSTDMYKAVLSILNQENTRSMEPDEFNLWINRVQLLYLQDKYSEFDKHQKRTDDINELIVKTDGLNGRPGPILNTGLSVAGQERFDLPYNLTSPGVNNRYMFLLSVAAKISYKGNKCYTDGTLSKFLKCKPMKLDVEFQQNFYERPKDSRLYYEMIDKQLVVLTGTQSYAKELMITYIRYPLEIFFDVTGAAHVDPELEPRVNIELVNACARMYIESIESPRVQTFPAFEKSFFN